MLVFTALAGLLIATFSILWPKRKIQSFVEVPNVSVELYAPHLDAVAAQSNVIVSLRTDASTNCLVVTAQSRYLDSARSEVRQLVQDESLIFAASAMGLTIAEVQQVRATER
jgi:hypothetical protein